MVGLDKTYKADAVPGPNGMNAASLHVSWTGYFGDPVSYLLSRFQVSTDRSQGIAPVEISSTLRYSSKLGRVSELRQQEGVIFCDSINVPVANSRQLKCRIGGRESHLGKHLGGIKSGR